MALTVKAQDIDKRKQSFNKIGQVKIGGIMLKNKALRDKLKGMVRYGVTKTTLKRKLLEGEVKNEWGGKREEIINASFVKENGLSEKQRKKINLERTKQLADAGKEKQAPRKRYAANITTGVRVKGTMERIGIKSTTVFAGDLKNKKLPDKPLPKISLTGSKPMGFGL